jgi:Beta-propeller repeat
MIVVCAILASARMHRADAGAPASLANRAAPADYSRLPVYFEQNRGQTDPRVQFLSRGPGYTVFLTRDGAVLALRKAEVAAAPAHRGDAPVKFKTASVWMKLAGARIGARSEGIDPLPGRVNYFIGNDPGQWHTNIPTYARVKYDAVYPGVDMIYYGTPQALEYDLVAAPGANPNAIRIELQGAERTHLDAAGDLIIGTAAGDVTMRRPRVYQERNGARSTVRADYVVSEAAAGKQMVALRIAAHDPQLPLVIDPEIVYSTYLGGKGDRGGPIQGFPTLPSQLTSLKFSDAAIDMTLGPNNTVYVAGLAYSSNFPATPGAFQATNRATPNTTPNGFVAKFDTTKSGAASLIYSTYLGGSGCSSPACKPGTDGDQATGVAVDTSGDAYVGGLTYSKNFPNPNCGAFGTGNNQSAANNNNGFVAELNPTGSGLIYSCFVHGSDDAAVSGIGIKPGCASKCAAYVAGNTRSKAGDYMVTASAFQATNPDTHNNSSGYVQVIAGDAKSLAYSTFLGGTGTSTGGESLTRVAVDSSGRVNVTGATFSSDYPTVNPFQSSNLAFPINAQNVVVSRLDPSKSGKASLLYSTYLGGSGLSIIFVGTFGDVGAGIALDSSNDIFVAGIAPSSNFPTNGIKPAFQPTSHSAGSGANAFVTELDPSQTTPAKQLVYSTYLGGTASLFGTPIRPGDAATDVAVDSVTEKIYLTGATTTTNFPLADTCKQLSSIGGQADAFVSVLDPDNPPATQLDFSTYLGGSDIDAGAAIARDSTDKIYLAGVTFSGDFPVTKSAFQFGNNAFAAGTTNAFVTKLDPSSTVCPTPFPSPSITATPTPKPTATIKPTAIITPTIKPTIIVPTPTPAGTKTATKTATKTPTPTPTPKPGTPVILSIPKALEVGSSFKITGTGFTPGSVVNFFVAKATGPANEGPLKPSSQTPTMLSVDIPDTIPLGQGFVSVQVVNTDKGFLASNLAYALLQGDAADGFPTITMINGKSLAPTSIDPNFATNNVETVVPQGTLVKIGGMGFDTANGVAIDLFCACPGGKVGPFFLNKGNPALTSTLLSFMLPAKGMPNSPPTGPGSFVVSNAGASKTFMKKSNAVSAPIGAQIMVSSVGQVGSLITVNGAGFSTLTVINFFNKQGAVAVNLGGLKPDGTPKIPLVVVNENKFTFTKPAGAMAGPSYVQALNPPFVPFTSSGNGPGGSFMLK